MCNTIRVTHIKCARTVYNTCIHASLCTLHLIYPRCIICTFDLHVTFWLPRAIHTCLICTSCSFLYFARNSIQLARISFWHRHGMLTWRDSARLFFLEDLGDSYGYNLTRMSLVLGNIRFSTPQPRRPSYLRTWGTCSYYIYIACHQAQSTYLHPTSEKCVMREASLSIKGTLSLLVMDP